MDQRKVTVDTDSKAKLKSEKSPTRTFLHDFLLDCGFLILVRAIKSTVEP